MSGIAKKFVDSATRTFAQHPIINALKVMAMPYPGTFPSETSHSRCIGEFLDNDEMTLKLKIPGNKNARYITSGHRFSRYIISLCMDNLKPPCSNSLCFSGRELSRHYGRTVMYSDSGSIFSAAILFALDKICGVPIVHTKVAK